MKRHQSGGPEDRAEEIVSGWKEFYTRARDLHNNPKEPIEKEEAYGFPKDDDPRLDAACEILSLALQKASKPKVKYDTTEVKQALDNLRNVYNEAAKSNPVTMRYIDVEPPSSPSSPLKRPNLQRMILARPWMKEMINGLCNQSLDPDLLVIGTPGGGKSVALVGYLLFYLITRGERTILQSPNKKGRLGFIFDDDGVREVFTHNSDIYDDGKPCVLLVSADGEEIFPEVDLEFCDRTVVVTSPNIKPKSGLTNWMKQIDAGIFIAPPPSCLEVVYLLSKIEMFDSFFVYWMYREWIRDFRRCRRNCKTAIPHLKEGTLCDWYGRKTAQIESLVQEMLSNGQAVDTQNRIPDKMTNMTISSDLVTMERHRGRTGESNIVFMTARIAKIVADVQEQKRWAFRPQCNWSC